MNASSHSALALAIALVGVPGHSADIRLSGTVTDLSGNALAGAHVALAGAGNAASTSTDGSWSITATSTGIVIQPMSNTGSITEHLTLDGNRIRLRFDGVDAAGRRSSAPGACGVASAKIVVAGRSTAIFADTLLYSWKGRILARMGITSLVAGAIGPQAIDTSTSGSDSAIPWNSTITYGTITDSRDGHVYRTVTIGTQTWMAQNLNYRNTTGISDSVGVCYDRKLDSCSKYGRMYTWAEVMNGSSSSRSIPSGVKGICPKGWHVPSDAEWTTLKQRIDPTGATAGTQLKSTSGWLDSKNGTDTYGFRVLPAGHHFEDGVFGYVEWDASFWTATEVGSSSTYWNPSFYHDKATVERSNVSGSYGSSLRCVEDPDTAGSADSWNRSVTYGVLKDVRDNQEYRTVTIGTQTWMAQNLNYRNTTGSTDSVGVCYNHNLDSCSRYGRLYTWPEATAGSSPSTSKPSGVKGICPMDWHVPSDSEWTTLERYVDWTGATTGSNLKSTSGWAGSGNGTDSYGLRVLPAGNHYSDGFSGIGGSTTFWSTSETQDPYFWDRELRKSDEGTHAIGTYKTVGCSIRCVRDVP